MTAKAYERKIDKLEKLKLVIADQLENSFQPKATLGANARTIDALPRKPL